MRDCASYLCRGRLGMRDCVSVYAEAGSECATASRPASVLLTQGWRSEPVDAVEAPTVPPCSRESTRWAGG